MEGREERIVVIRNLFDSRISEELLYELFLQAGPINSISMPVGHNGKRTMAIIEYTHEVAVPYALFIFDGTELYGSHICLSSANRNPPIFCSSNDTKLLKYASHQSPPVHQSLYRDISMEPRNNSHRSSDSTVIMNISNSNPFIEQNFDQLLQMSQNMLGPPMFSNSPLSYFGGSNDVRQFDMRDRDRDRSDRDRDDSHSQRNYHHRNKSRHGHRRR